MNPCPRIVETTGARMFGLDDGEVAQRRRYVSHVRGQIEVRGA
jgi:syntaxin 6